MLDQTAIEGAALFAEAVAEQIGKTVVMASKGLHVLRAVLGARPAADGVTKTGMVPPCRMPARQRRDDGHRLLARRRQRPLGRDHMAVGEILEQEMPGPALLVEAP